MDTFMDKYKELLAADREVTRRMVKNGELSEEDAEFRDMMREDEILELMED